MITYTEKGAGLHKAIEDAGYIIKNIDGVWLSSDDVAVQAIIDSFDQLIYEQSEAKEKVKEAASNARARYVSGGAGKDAEYSFKAQEAKQFSIDASIGVFMQGRMTETGETADVIAKEWNTRSSQWQAVGAKIAGLEDKAKADINAETNWQNCSVIADAAISVIDSI